MATGHRADSGTHTPEIAGGPQVFSASIAGSLTYGELCEATIDAGKVHDADHGPADTLMDVAWSFTIETEVCAGETTPIAAIQGNGAASPPGRRNGDGLGNRDGRISRAGLGGLFVQSRSDQTDDDPATSEGLFVVFEDPPATQSGRHLTDLRAGGRARRPYRFDPRGGAAICGSGTPAIPSVWKACPTPAGWEAIENMWVIYNDPMTVVGNDDLGAAGELVLIPGDRPSYPTDTQAPGTPAYEALQSHLSRQFIVDDGRMGSPPAQSLLAPTTPSGPVTLTTLEGIVDGYGGESADFTPRPLDITYNRNPARRGVPAGACRVASVDLGDFGASSDVGFRGPSGTARHTNGNKPKLSPCWWRWMDVIALTGLGGNVDTSRDLLTTLNTNLGEVEYALLDSPVARIISSGRRNFLPARSG
ncbi:MAG: hypothetical protein R3C44_09520 [Chloroflexota bacterium]